MKTINRPDSQEALIARAKEGIVFQAQLHKKLLASLVANQSEIMIEDIDSTFIDLSIEEAVDLLQYDEMNAVSSPAQKEAIKNLAAIKSKIGAMATSDTVGMPAATVIVRNSTYITLLEKTISAEADLEISLPRASNGRGTKQAILENILRLRRDGDIPSDMQAVELCKTAINEVLKRNPSNAPGIVDQLAYIVENSLCSKREARELFNHIAKTLESYIDSPGEKPPTKSMFSPENTDRERQPSAIRSLVGAAALAAIAAVAITLYKNPNFFGTEEAPVSINRPAITEPPTTKPVIEKRRTRPAKSIEKAPKISTKTFQLVFEPNADGKLSINLERTFPGAKQIEIQQLDGNSCYVAEYENPSSRVCLSRAKVRELKATLTSTASSVQTATVAGMEATLISWE